MLKNDQSRLGLASLLDQIKKPEHQVSEDADQKTLEEIRDLDRAHRAADLSQKLQDIEARKRRIQI